jgi:hypothetical protein
MVTSLSEFVVATGFMDALGFVLGLCLACSTSRLRENIVAFESSLLLKCLQDWVV